MRGKRPLVRLQMTAPDKRALEAWCRSRGVRQAAVVGRLVDWLVTQDEIIQAAVLGLLSGEALKDLARQALEQRLAQDARPSGDGAAPAAGRGRRRGDGPAGRSDGPESGSAS